MRYSQKFNLVYFKAILDTLKNNDKLGTTLLLYPSPLTLDKQHEKSRVTQDGDIHLWSNAAVGFLLP